MVHRERRAAQASQQTSQPRRHPSRYYRDPAGHGSSEPGDSSPVETEASGDHIAATSTRSTSGIGPRPEAVTAPRDLRPVAPRPCPWPGREQSVCRELVEDLVQRARRHLSLQAQCDLAATSATASASARRPRQVDGPSDTKSKPQSAPLLPAGQGEHRRRSGCDCLRAKAGHRVVAASSGSSTDRPV